MIKIANAQLWVHDQDEALAFYTQKLGMEVSRGCHPPGGGRLPLAYRRAGGAAGLRDRC